MIANADRVRQYVEEHELETLFADGLDDAVIGLTRELNSGAYRVVYDTARVLQILMNDQGMEEEEAIEHMHCNIIGAYVGDSTPVWTFLPEEE